MSVGWSGMSAKQQKFPSKATSARYVEENSKRRHRLVKVVQKRTPERAAVDFSAIPEHQTDAMCRTVIGCLGRLFEIPEVRADYERWKRNRQQKGTTA